MPSRRPRHRLAETLPRYRRVREDWIAAGVLQQDLADALGIRSETLSRYLTGKATPPRDLEQRLRDAISAAQEIHQERRRAEIQAELDRMNAARSEPAA